MAFSIRNFRKTAGNMREALQRRIGAFGKKRQDGGEPDVKSPPVGGKGFAFGRFRKRTPAAPVKPLQKDGDVIKNEDKTNE